MSGVNDMVAALRGVDRTNVDGLVEALERISGVEPQKCEQVELAKDLNELLALEVPRVSTAVAKCVAEVTKVTVQREKFTSDETIRPLLKILATPSALLELQIQTCRALGNICYDNQPAREKIFAQKGDSVLIALLDQEANVEDEMARQFVKTRCGLISNYLVGSEAIAERAIELKIMDKLIALVRHGTEDVKKNELLLLNTLPLLSILTEMLSDLNFEPELNKQLVQVVRHCTDPDLGEMCLELLQYQAENDDVKMLLAHEGLCETLFSLLEKYKSVVSSEEARALMKLACDLIVLILNGDDSMHYLYTTPFRASMEQWLDSYDLDLLTTGVLAIGNFARTDSHCIRLVEDKIMDKLITILARNNGTDDDHRLQHALLSALRNLVIPKPNKAAVVDAGLVETILPMLETHQPPVLFKLLGTLRMTIDGQEQLARRLLQDEKLLNQLILWSQTIDFHAGVMAESLRLMAWLIKHAYKDAKAPVDDAPLRAFVATEAAVEAMVNMLISSHVIMQNEALIALCLLSTRLQSADEARLDELLIKAAIGAKIAEFIQKNADTMTKEIVENLQTLIRLLRASDRTSAHLNEHKVDELVKTIPSLVEICTL